MRSLVSALMLALLVSAGCRDETPGAAGPDSGADSGTAEPDLSATVPSAPAFSSDLVPFRAVGNEPGWVLRIEPDLPIHLSYDYGQANAYFASEEPSVDSVTGLITYELVSDSSSLRVEIDPIRCSDTMSDETFETTVTVVIDGRTLRGCGGSPPAG